MGLTPEQVENIAVAAASRAATRAAREAVEAAAAKARKEASALVAEAVRQTLLQLGIDSANPLEMQRDFQHLRQWRRAGEDLRGKGLAILVSVFVTGLVGLLLVGVRDWFGR